MANLSWISSNPDYINQMIRNTQVTLSNNYNDLDNIPIIKITSTTNNPQKIWELKEGLYMIDGVVQVDNNTSYEVSNLLISMTARLENGKYILSAFIPYLRGLFEYILKTNSTEYEQHQKIVLMIKNDTLALDNETIYTPIEDYHPATKKYVDDKANEIVAELDKMGVNKENLESLNKENRIRDIKLQALLSETSDRNITIEENVRYFDMPLSIDNGIVTINEIVGETLVNVCDQEESVAITKSYTVENESHIPLQGEYDGKCRPVLHGNTLVNHNADWDDSLQTGIETSANGTEDVQVEGIKGQEVSVVVEGNTVLNHALGKTSAVVSSIESENEGNYVDLTVANDMSSVVEIEGRTMVNVCDQKDPIAITKSYAVENSGNHIALQGEYDGSCRPVIHGNTMVNLAPKYTINWTHSGTWQSLFLMGTQANATVKILQDLKPATTYTIIVNITKNTQSGYTLLNNYHEGTSVFLTHMHINPEDLGIKTFVATTRDSFDTLDPTTTVILRSQSSGIASGETVIEDIMIFEGDLTQTPELIPTEYVEGLKSSFEDGYIPEAKLISNGITITSNGATTGNDRVIDIQGLKSNVTYTIICDINNSDNLHLGFYNKETWNGSGTIKGYDTHKTKIIYSWVKQNSQTHIGLYTNNPNAGINYSLSNLIILEGDWTHLTEEDCNNLGKYKVQYKVTGKNKFNGVFKVGTITNGSYDDSWIGYMVTDYIKLKRNSQYYSKILYNNTQLDMFIKPFYYDANFNYLGTDTETSVYPIIKTLDIPFTYCILRYYIRDGAYDKTLLSNIQIEEGTVATEYEPYKEYTKTFYLNSPLLEGDTIEDINGVATHVKRYDKVVLDGSEYWDILGTNVPFGSYKLPLKPNGNMTSTEHGAFCDNFPLNTIVSNDINDTRKGVYVVGGGSYSNLRIRITDTDTQNSIKEYLQANPTTVVYQLASPIYEKISDESILCDSYVNGHLDFDSTVPIEKVMFRRPLLTLKYLKENTKYTIQFKSDNIGTSRIAIGGDLVYIGGSAQLDIVKGINKFEVDYTTGTNIALYFNGIGFNASNIVVTEAIDADFDYFEGLSSTYESCYPGGKNLFDGAIIENEFVDNTGVFIKDNGMLRTDYIKIKPNITYTISNSNKNTKYTYYRFFDSNKVFISYGQNNTHTIYCTTPKNAKYLIVCYLKTDILSDTTIQIEEGSTATSYEPFIDKYKVDVKVTGKNLCDNVFEWGNIDLDTGNMNGSSTTARSKNFISVKPNTDYILSSNGSVTIGGQLTFRFYDENFNYLPFGSGYVTQTTVGGKGYATCKSLNNARYVKIRVGAINDGVLPIDIQLEEGTVATSYEPYFESTKTFYLNSPLLEGDKIVTKNGKVYHYHKMGMVVLDGSEDWKSYGNGSAARLLVSEVRVYSSSMIVPNMYCDSLPVLALTPLTEACHGISIGTSTNITIYVQNITSLDGIKQWLQVNPTTAVYELASPYYELIDEYNNTILNIPKNVAHLTHTSAVPVNNTVFTNYVDELTVLEANTQYRVMFDCDKANVPFTVTLGGTSQTVTSKIGTHSLLITTPSTLVDKNLVIDGIGRCGIDNIRVFKGNVECDYVKGLWSGYEERKLENLTDITEADIYSTGSIIANWWAIPIKNFPNHKVYTVICDKTEKTGITIYDSVGEGVESMIGINDESHFVRKFKKYSDRYAYIGIITNDKNKNVRHSIYNILILEGDWTDNPPTYEEVMANEGKYAVKVKLDNPSATIFGKGGRL